MAITKRPAADLAKQAFEYAPAPEAVDHVRIQPHYGLFVGGRMLEPHSKKRFPTINPATEQTLTTIAAANAEQKVNAIAAGVQEGLQNGKTAHVVDINSASKEQLSMLPGISPVRNKNLLRALVPH